MAQGRPKGGADPLDRRRSAQYARQATHQLHRGVALSMTESTIRTGETTRDTSRDAPHDTPPEAPSDTLRDVSHDTPLDSESEVPPNLPSGNQADILAEVGVGRPARTTEKVRSRIAQDAARRRYLNAFLHVGGIGPRRLAALEHRFGSLRAAWSASEVLLREAIGPVSAGYVVERRTRIDIDSAWAGIEASGARMITPDDPSWPSALREISGAPFALFVRGEVESLGRTAVAIVGTRKCSDYGRRSAWAIATGLSQAGLSIVSGMALGIDTIAHRAALSAGGETVAVLGCGVDVCYPTQNEELRDSIVSQGAVVSEFPPGTPALPGHFPARNRIVSGLCLATIVIEAGVKSGALITARYAADQGREVFALPGRVDDATAQGTNGLIAAGAGLATSAEDILCAIDADRRQAELGAREDFPDAPHERALCELLDDEPRHIDELVEESSLAPSDVARALAMLELKGMAKNIGAMRWLAGSALPPVHSRGRTDFPDSPEEADEQ